MSGIEGRMTTYKELIDLVLDYGGATVDAVALRFARQACQSAIREIQNQRRWSYYYSRLRVTTSPMQTTGTVTFDLTGGAYERLLTIAGGTWPTWAMFGTVVIANIPYEVAEYKSTTQITLTELSNPGADVAAGTAYTLYRDTYPLPGDFINLDTPRISGSLISDLEYVHPDEWSYMQSNRSQGTPNTYTIRGDPNYMGVMALSLFPAPDAVYVLDAVYNRKPRPLTVEEYAVGTATATSNSLTLTGSGTGWGQSHVGSVIRFSSGSLKTPTGRGGSDPFHLERVVMSVETPTSLTLDAITGEALTGVKYSISSPVDVEESMMELVTLEAYKRFRIKRRLVPGPEEEKEYERSKARASEADSRSAAPRAEYKHGVFYPWLRTARTSFEVV